MEKNMETTIMTIMVIKDYCKDPIPNHLQSLFLKIATVENYFPSFSFHTW